MYQHMIFIIYVLHNSNSDTILSETSGGKMKEFNIGTG